MREADEINSAFLTGKQVRLHPPSGRDTVAVSCVEPYQATMMRLSPIKGYDTVRRWASRWQPKHYTFNMMPGLPLWLFWRWNNMGVPTTAIVRSGQLDAYPEIRRFLDLAIERVGRIETVATKDERDAACRAAGVPITVEHVTNGLSPES